MSEFERMTKTFTIDETLQKQVQELEADGWKPAVPPVIVYHLIREKKTEEPYSGGALGKMRINDDLVMVIGPDGKRKQ